jgi:hypothetical protein
VASVKAKILQKEGVPQDRQRLTFAVGCQLAIRRSTILNFKRQQLEDDSRLIGYQTFCRPTFCRPTFCRPTFCRPHSADQHFADGIARIPIFPLFLCSPHLPFVHSPAIVTRDRKMSINQTQTSQLIHPTFHATVET